MKNAKMKKRASEGAKNLYVNKYKNKILKIWYYIVL